MKRIYLVIIFGIVIQTIVNAQSIHLERLYSDTGYLSLDFFSDSTFKIRGCFKPEQFVEIKGTWTVNGRKLVLTELNDGKSKKYIETPILILENDSIRNHQNSFHLNGLKYSTFNLKAKIMLHVNRLPFWDGMIEFNDNCLKRVYKKYNVTLLNKWYRKKRTVEEIDKKIGLGWFYFYSIDIASCNCFGD